MHTFSCCGVRKNDKNINVQKHQVLHYSLYFVYVHILLRIHTIFIQLHIIIYILSNQLLFLANY